MTDEPRPTDLTKLQIAQTLRDYHHKALWEEEKHFMWFVSIFLSADLLLATTDKLTTSAKGAFIALVSTLGTVICLVGLRVLRKEGQYFQDALLRFVNQHNICFQDVPLNLPRRAANKPVRLLLLDALHGKASVRDTFQSLFCLFLLVFVIAAAVGLALSVVAAVTASSTTTQVPPALPPVK